MAQYLLQAKELFCLIAHLLMEEEDIFLLFCALVKTSAVVCTVGKGQHFRYAIAFRCVSLVLRSSTACLS